MPKTEQKRHKAFLIIICIACAVFLLMTVYPHKMYNPDSAQILALKLAEARNIEFDNLQNILSEFGMRISALEQRKPTTIIKYMPRKKGKG